MLSISKIATLWPENEDFYLDRTNSPEEVVFIYCHTPIKLLSGNEFIECAPNTAVFFAPSAHQVFYANGHKLRHDWMHITGDAVPVFQKLGIEFGRPYEIKNTDFITEAIQELELEFIHQTTLSKEITDNKINGFLLEFARCISQKEAITSDAKNLMQFARTQIHHKFGEAWTAKKMAGLVHLSPSRFFCLYSRAFGISPKKDLQRVRMEHAKHLLMQNKYTVKEVAEQIGYENEYFFIRKFKAEIGETPGNFKKRFNT